MPLRRGTTTIGGFMFSAMLLTTHSGFGQSPPSNPYWGRSTPAPTVSPYLNMTVDENGLSNYPSLVRPMLAQRELLARQAAEERLQGRSRATNRLATGDSANGEPRRPPGTFMNYSHYFGGNR